MKLCGECHEVATVKLTRYSYALFDGHLCVFYYCSACYNLERRLLLRFPDRWVVEKL